MREVVDVETRRLFGRCLQVRIEAEISQHQIRSAVAAQIDGLDTVPPAVGARQSRFLRSVDKLAVFLVEDTHRHPLSDNDEIQLAVVVVVDPRRRRHHPRR